MNNSEYDPRENIDSNEHMVISTANLEAKPWISPVFYVPDDNYNLYWVSAKDAVHSGNVRDNAGIAIVIWGPPSAPLRALYIDAQAKELESPDEIEQAIAVLARRPQPDKFVTKSIEDVTGDASWRIYKATPAQLFFRTDATDPASGQVISVRVPASL